MIGKVKIESEVKKRMDVIILQIHEKSTLVNPVSKSAIPYQILGDNEELALSLVVRKIHG